MSEIKLPSAHQFGDNVWVNLWGTELIGEICAVHFFLGKVKYDVKTFGEDGDYTKLYLVDSAFVTAKKIKG
jgi:hypothetical protein